MYLYDGGGVFPIPNATFYILIICLMRADLIYMQFWCDLHVLKVL